MARSGADVERTPDLCVADELAGSSKEREGTDRFFAYRACVSVAVEERMKRAGVHGHVVERECHIGEVPVVAAVVEVDRAELAVPEEVVELKVAMNQPEGALVAWEGAN